MAIISLLTLLTEILPWLQTLKVLNHLILVEGIVQNHRDITINAQNLHPGAVNQNHRNVEVIAQNHHLEEVITQNHLPVALVRKHRQEENVQNLRPQGCQNPLVKVKNLLKHK